MIQPQTTTSGRFGQHLWAVWLAAGAVVLIVLFSLLAPLIAPFNPLTQNLALTLDPPGTTHLMGTDGLGRDILSRVLWGGRPPILIALASVGAALAIGVLLGLLAGYLGGSTERFLVALSDVQLTIPGLVMALLVLVLFGNSMVNVIIVIALESWPLHFRMVRAQAQTIRKQAFVEAAQLAGIARSKIVLRHVLPPVLPVLAVSATMNFGGAILAEASLSFLGLGIQPPTPDWGAMISDGQSQLGWAWWVAVFPAIALFGLLLATQILGNWLSDRFAAGKEW